MALRVRSRVRERVDGQGGIAPPRLTQVGPRPRGERVQKAKVLTARAGSVL